MKHMYLPLRISNENVVPKESCFLSDVVIWNFLFEAVVYIRDRRDLWRTKQ